MRLVDVYSEPGSLEILYDLLGERVPEQNISHVSMPTMAEHETFVASRPYAHWYLIGDDRAYVGAVYLSRAREVGLFVFRKYRGKGYGRRALARLREYHPGPVLANIAPGNNASIRFFEVSGFSHIQNTYRSDG